MIVWRIQYQDRCGKQQVFFHELSHQPSYEQAISLIQRKALDARRMQTPYTQIEETSSLAGIQLVAIDALPRGLCE